MISRHSLREDAPAADERIEDDLPDRTLLRRYVTQNSEAAFARIIHRHLGLVYATCRREAGDLDLAEDAAQAVFLILAKKAPRLRGGDGLAGWLFQTARLTARNAVRQERSRLRREQAAADALRREEPPPGDPGKDDHSWEAIEPHINAAVARLRPADREAVLLRFFEGRNLAEVGAQLGVSENTARMRVARAVERMRRHLAREGAILGGAALAVLLTDHAAEAAPAATLAAALPIAATQVGHLAMGLAAANAIQLAQGALHTMWMKTVTACASVFAVAAVATAVAATSYYNRLSEVDWTDSSTSGVNLNFQQGLTGWYKAAPNSSAPDYAIQADPSGPAPHQASAFLTARVAHPYSYGTLMQGVRADRYRGKRVRLSAQLRTANVPGEAGLWIRLDAPKDIRAWNMAQRPIRGTTPWRRYSYVLDVPADAQGMAYGCDLTGTGKVWLADVQLEVVPESTPATPDISEAAHGDTDRVIDLWELGIEHRYQKEAAAAHQILADPNAWPSERCMALESLASAQMQLGRRSEARAALAQFDTERQGLEIIHDVVTESKDLHKKLDRA
ncbi:hypothetical protein CCAX7_16660 [Capsulimonas corticalis]|uniref:Sigma-70 family RNA polymerase sigma factor n=1 Tax=Capsulimonas corticalis TaxID=2219043 RepID=A0A9N7Q9U6_9BACT|nr:sigma-70 family RNA polymerase sigma factor [Capsulimonas corticalis]BDI29615.1 hypothetical protein CCAX7_16660 [Capsulimonas corticalis]